MSGCWGVIKGFLYQEPIEKISNAGTKFSSARLKVRDKDKTVFWSVSAFDEGAQSLLSFKEGDGIKIEGSVKASTYSDKNGVAQIGFAIMTRLVEPFEPKQSSQRATHSSSHVAARKNNVRSLEAVAANGGPRHYPQRNPLNDDIPF